MKKVLFIALALVSLAFVSCNKEENPSNGTYSPENKILTVYAGTSGGGRVIAQKWNWDENTLRSIDYYSNNIISYTDSYVYENDRMVRVNDFLNNWYASFTYDSKNISKIDVYDQNQLARCYEMTYNGNKPNRMTLTDYGVAQFKSVNRDFNPFQYLFPGQPQTYEMLYNEMNNRDTKATVVQIYTLTWEGDNLVKMEGSTQGASMLNNYNFDTKTNPWLGFMTSGALRMSSFNKNNILSSTEQLTWTVTSTITGLEVTNSRSTNSNYSYVYENEVPVQVTYNARITQHVNGVDAEEVETSVVYYEYK